jgi:O-antigen/teichoic acid export membrane protein
LLKEYINKKYLLYGGAIVFTRGFELLVLFFAAHLLSKDDYGTLEFYKKVIEVGSSFLAFGFPALIMSYTRGENSKRYFYVLALLFVALLSILILPIFYFYGLLFLLIPLVFYAVFFNGSITQNFLLVQKGSDTVALYKIIISLLFYGSVAIMIYYYHIKAMAFVYPSYVLMLPYMLITFVILKNQRIVRRKLMQYGKLFYSLLLSSFTLVVSNFANLMFLYTDIFVIKIFSEHANVQIANYSFSLNIANALMLIPLTLVQADVEQLKKTSKEIPVLFKKILVLVLLAILLLTGFYYGLISLAFEKYADTFVLFLIILSAKFFQALTPLFGTYLTILKKFKPNLLVNLATLLFNIAFSYILFFTNGVYGVAAASFISLFLRFVVLVWLVDKEVNLKLKDFVFKK